MNRDTEATPFYSIPRSLWWVVVTITTVGYGDYYPTTILGKTVGFVTVLASALLLALPVTIIGNEFTNEYEQQLKEGHPALFATQELEFKPLQSVKSLLPRKSKLEHMFDVHSFNSTMVTGKSEAHTGESANSDPAPEEEFPEKRQSFVQHSPLEIGARGPAGAKSFDAQERDHSLI